MLIVFVIPNGFTILPLFCVAYMVLLICLLATLFHPPYKHSTVLQGMRIFVPHELKSGRIKSTMYGQIFCSFGVAEQTYGAVTPQQKAQGPAAVLIYGVAVVYKKILFLWNSQGIVL